MPRQAGPSCLAIAGDEGPVFPAHIARVRVSLLGGSWELKEKWCAPISIQGYKTRYQEGIMAKEPVGALCQCQSLESCNISNIALSSKASGFRCAAQLSGSRSRCDPRETWVA